MDKKKEAGSALDRVMDAFGNLLPDCGTALDLAQTGAQRPLRLSEKVRLKYNSRLCLYCSCKKDKFAEAMDSMRAAQDARTAKPSGR